jgi:hypothetical protein
MGAIAVILLVGLLLALGPKPESGLTGDPTTQAPPPPYKRGG